MADSKGTYHGRIERNLLWLIRTEPAKGGWQIRLECAMVDSVEWNLPWQIRFKCAMVDSIDWNLLWQIRISFYFSIRDTGKVRFGVSLTTNIGEL